MLPFFERQPGDGEEQARIIFWMLFVPALVARTSSAACRSWSPA
jgi:hypothetical protein